MPREYQICTRCVMDTTDADITFDEKGVCNHCRNYAVSVKKGVFTGKEAEQRLKAIVKKIKANGKNRKYDSVIGLSGGADSTYVAYLANKLGLKPLAIHLDNGWNTEISSENIKRVVDKLDFDLHTYVIVWEEFRDIQLAYLRASVIDIEAISDHAVTALLYNTAAEKGIKYIISGANIATEGTMPGSWLHNKNDLTNIRDIHRKFGKIRLKTFPTLGLGKILFYQYVKGITHVPILNYVPYDSKDAKELLARELGWEDYGSKHFESVFTRFYQAYILPRKFNIDKRKAHLSTLICSGQMSREDAVRELQISPYTEEVLKRDKEYVLKKLALTDAEFEDIINLPVKNHRDYKTDARWYAALSLINRTFHLKSLLKRV